MTNIIYDEKNERVLAIAESEEMANYLAECICYIRNGNSIYGLFGIQVVSMSAAGQPDQTVESGVAAEKFRKAYDRFMGNVR